MRALILALLSVGFTAEAQAQPSVSLVCRVEKKVDADRAYSQDDLERFRYSVEIKYDGKSAQLRRCSFAPSVGHVTCDEYEVDRVVSDPDIGVRKFYHFSSQFDVQLFQDGQFVENNGRGSVAYGRCTKA